MTQNQNLVDAANLLRLALGVVQELQQIDNSVLSRAAIEAGRPLVEKQVEQALRYLTHA
jgi:hypothetical protein